MYVIWLNNFWTTNATTYKIILKLNIIFIYVYN